MLRLILLRLSESYFRHRWIYLLPCLVMAGAAYFYISRLPATYIAQGTIYAQDKTLLSAMTAIGNDGYTWVTPAQATVSELYELLNTQAFLRAIVEKTDLEIKLDEGNDALNSTIGEARDAIWTQTLGNNLVLIGAAHEMPRVAHQLVSATIETYVLWKTNLSRDDSVTAQQFFSDLINTYQAEVEPAREQLAAYLEAHPRPVRGDRPELETAEIARLQAAVTRAEERLSHAQNQEESARLALVQTESDVRQSYSVVDAPLRPLAPERATKELLVTLIMFVAAGAVLTITGIVGGALLDQSFRFPLDVKQTLSLPTLAQIEETAIALLEAPTTSKDNTSSAYSDDDVVKSNGKQSAPKVNGVLHRRRIFG